MASSSGAGGLKRKRQLLPLGIPPPQLPPVAPEERTPVRANRACNTCRRQKIRCDGPEKGVPCVRCKNLGVDCAFEKIPLVKAPAATTTSRITSLESRLDIMQATQVQMQESIQEILYELRRSSEDYHSSGCAELGTSNPSHVSEEHKPLSLSSFRHKMPSSRSSLETPSSDEPSRVESSYLSSNLARSANASLPPIQSLLSPCVTSSDYAYNSSSRSHTANIPSHPYKASFVEVSRPNFPGPKSTAPNSAWTDTNLSGESGKIATQNSEVRDDATSGRRDTEIAQWASDDNVSRKGIAQNQRRVSARQVLREDEHHNWNADDHIKLFDLQDTSTPDGIKRGLLTESEARELFDLFFERCHPRLPIFEPRIDTFSSLRTRSSFCLCCLLMAASKARDGGNKPSALQLALWDEAMVRAKESMFQRVKDLEVIQGLLLLSAWSESTGGTCWILAGHAIRCGVEMGIHKALTKLVSEVPSVDEEAQQILVSSARVWCALFAFEYQLSLGIGRHTMTGHPRSIKNARNVLLRHPLSNPSDMRLVSACEIMLMEYQILDTLPTTDAEDPRCQAHLREGRSRMDIWHSEWDLLLSPFFPSKHYMRQTLAVHRGYGYMTVHMACMQRIITSTDIDAASHWEKENCFIAVSAAKEIARISVEEESYRDGLRYSPTCFYSGVSFVGALILRLGSILPREGRYLFSLATELARVLEDVPTCRFKFSFTTLLEEKNSEARDFDEASTSPPKDQK